MANKDFSVNDLIDSYADSMEMDPKEIFKRNPVSGNVKAEAEAEAKEAQPVQEPKKKKNGIDPAMVADMPEFKQPGAVYEKDEVILEEDKTLLNIADEETMKDAANTMGDLEMKEQNIEECKRRNNIDKLHIPEGEFQYRMLLAASNTNHAEAQKELDAVLKEIQELHPEMIEFKSGTIDDSPSVEKKVETDVEDFPIPEPTTEDEGIEFDSFGTANEPAITPIPKSKDEKPSEEVKVTIDKRSLPEISWSPEEVEKIKKSRTVELNIVEGVDVEFGNIVDVDTSNIDAVLSKYQRKTNDVVAALPASKYRATFTGLTYPEVIDLSTSNEMNNLDGERKKWSICYDHLKNPSIGPFQEYYLYKDPVTNKELRVETSDKIPKGVVETDVHYVSRYEDFLRKTSYMDLEFMLWKILCATSMDEEVISIDCNSRIDGKVCGNSYEWIYRPSELLDVESISEAVLEEMKQTGEASSTQEIMECYNSSPVHANSYVKLKTSGLLAVFGHISGYEYLDDIYSKIKELENADNTDPTVVSRAYAYTVLTTIKAFIIPDPDDNGVYHRITGTENLLKVILSLDEIDWETVSQITQMMIEPYQFRYVMKDIVCPKCHSKSSIPIESMDRLLFILARSIQSIQVTLTRH